MSSTHSLKNKIDSITPEDIARFFSDIRKSIDEQEKAIITGTASEANFSLIENVVRGNDEAMWQSMRTALNIRMVESMMEKYLKYLATLDKLPHRLAFAFGPTTVMVWAEVNDDDEKLTLDLLLAEASVIPQYSIHGIYMQTMVVEKSEERKIPRGYMEFPLLSNPQSSVKN